MRVGIVAAWFNRGQGVVARYLRSAVDELGHESFVLARPTRPTNRRPAFVARDDVWDQPGVTAASHHVVPLEEYERWAAECELDVALFDQNYQFAEIASLRRGGLCTIGRFVWEHFAPADVDGAKQAFDVVYSLTACERERYATLGIDSPRVVWGCHPELTAIRVQRTEPPVRMFFPGGFMSKRKPLRALLEAFSRVEGEELRLLVKAQVERQTRMLERMKARDARIEVSTEDLATAEHHRLFASCHACLAPSRWEGLGLHLFEAFAFGLPILTTDIQPMNETVVDGVNGLLVAPRPSEYPTRSGIPSFDPDPEGLVEAIRRLRDRELRERLSAGAAQTARELPWSRTVSDLGAVLEHATAGVSR